MRQTGLISSLVKNGKEPRLRIPRGSRWDLTPDEARALQERMRRQVRTSKLLWRGLERIAGCDVALAGENLVAAVVVFGLPDMEPIETASAVRPVRFPYLPGLLGFREIPVLLAALRKLRNVPQAILCDGQGRAHPRRFGLASHLGVLLDLPTVGCARSRLSGTHRQPGSLRGNWAPLTEQGEILGAVLRTRDGVRPLYVSAGHRVTLRDSVRLVLACGGGYRLPEPTRQADLLVRRLAADLRRKGR